VAVDWIRLVQDRVQRRDLVKPVINFVFYERREISWPAGWLSASQESFCSVGLFVNILLTLNFSILSALRCRLIHLDTWCRQWQVWSASRFPPPSMNFNTHRQPSCLFNHY